MEGDDYRDQYCLTQMRCHLCQFTFQEEELIVACMSYPTSTIYSHQVLPSCLHELMSSQTSILNV